MKKNKDTAGEKILSITGGLCLLLALFLTTFQMVVFNHNFAHAEMEKYEVASKVGMSKEDLNGLFDTMLLYLDDSIQNFDVDVTVDGVVQKAFSEKEILHMVDVKGLFSAGFLIRNITAIVWAGSMLILLFGSRNRSHRLACAARGFLKASGLFVVLLGVLGGAIALDFDRAFILFHELFFTNDFWILDYNTDILMNLVPESYSFDVIRTVVILYAVVFAALVLASVLYLIRNKKKEIKKALIP